MIIERSKEYTNNPTKIGFKDYLNLLFHWENNSCLKEQKRIMYVPPGKQFYQVSVNRIKIQWPYLTAASGMITSNISVYYFTIYSYIRFSKKSNQGDKMTNSIDSRFGPLGLSASNNLVPTNRKVVVCTFGRLCYPRLRRGRC